MLREVNRNTTKKRHYFNSGVFSLQPYIKEKPMNINELNTLLRSRLMTRGIPCKVHELKDGSFYVSVTITGSALSIDVPYTIRTDDDGVVIVCSDDKVYEVKKLTSAIAVIAKDIRSQRSTLQKFTKRA